MTIRRIQQSDFADVDALLHTAFSASKRGYHDEAALVAELRGCTKESLTVSTKKKTPFRSCSSVRGFSSW